MLTNSVSVGVSRLRAVYGNSVKVFGSIPNAASGETVTVTLSTYGRAPVTKSVVTDGGTYDFTFRPAANTDSPRPERHRRARLRRRSACARS